MFPRTTRNITGATAGVTVQLGFRPTAVLLVNTTDGTGVMYFSGMAAATGLALGTTGAANIASGGITLGTQGVIIGASALPDTKAGVLYVFG